MRFQPARTRSGGMGLRACVLVWGLALAGNAQLPAFPGAEGQGAAAAGGRGGDVYYVTNLDDSGPGSLRNGIDSATGPRTILFGVSGNIRLLSTLAVTKPRITIAGQTAPGDGICLQDYLLYLEADDLVVRHIRSRLGIGALQDTDAIWIAGGSRVILDHCSASWSVDETLSATRKAKDVTVQWCFITESLNRPFATQESHGYGSLLDPGVNAGYSFHHNLYAHHQSRSPRPGSEDAKTLRLDFRNNVVYNWGRRAGYSGGTDEFVDMNYVANYLVKGLSSTYDYAFQGGGATTRIFQSGNLIDLTRNRVFDGADTGWAMFSEEYTKIGSPFAVAAVATDAAEVALQRVLAQAGALPWRRDAADARVAGNVRLGSGRIIDRPTQVGGWPVLRSAPAPLDGDEDGMPDYWETALGSDPLVADKDADPDLDGYTLLEDYLNWLAAPHAVSSEGAWVDIDLRALNGSVEGLEFTLRDGLGGAVSLLADGRTARFAPAPGFSGRATFEYTAADPVHGAGFGPVAVPVLVVAPNTAPGLVVPSSCDVIAGATLAFSALGSDGDQPPQSLAFALADPPAGAVIDPESGMFAWRPTMAQAGTTNAVEVLVYDNGTPPLGASRSVAIVVRWPAQPVVEEISQAGGRIRLVVSGDVGPDYHFQTSSDLAQWQTAFVAGAPQLPLEWTDPESPAGGSRFYRLVLGP